MTTPIPAAPDIRESERGRPTPEDGNGRWHGGWRSGVLQSVTALDDLVEDMQADSEINGDIERVKARIAEAREVAEQPGHSFATWLRGGEIDHAWTCIHEAEEILISHSKDDDWIKTVVAEHRRDLPSSHPAVEHLNEDTSSGLAVRGRTLVHEAHVATSNRDKDVRKSRNLLLTLSLACFVAAGGLLAFQAGIPNSPIIPDPAKSNLAAWVVLSITLVGGLIGGLVSAAPLLTERNPGRSDLTPARALQRISMGTITGFLGVLLLMSGWVVTGQITSTATLFLVAVAFGYAQEIVGRTIDRNLSDITKPKA